MLFDRVCNTVLESNEIKDDFELITPEKYSHAIVINYFRGHYELYEVEMISNVYADNEDEIPLLSKKGKYEGPIPPEGYIKANITTGRDIIDLYNTSGDDNIIPGSYYIIKYPEAKLQRLHRQEKLDYYEAYLKPAESAFDYTSKDTEDVFKDLTDAL